jgi:DNA-binding transcriptional MerR regulator
VEPVDAVLGVGVFARPDPGAEPVDPLLSIGVFARRSRLSLKALRLYDRLGLLTPAHVDPGTGYRRYRASQLATARLIGMLRRLDMPLSVVGELVSAGGSDAARRLGDYWDAVERRVASQRELAAHLRTRLEGDERTFAGFAVRERDVPEQLLLTDQRHVLIDELEGWIVPTTRRLAVLAGNEHGGVAGPGLVIFHGEVNHDSDGPVEVCVPVDPARSGRRGRGMRVEPAHREAYVRLRKAQVAYPQILSAYDAVAQWMTDRGLPGTGSPREVYFADFPSAAPGDEVCDVAFPIG